MLPTDGENQDLDQRIADMQKSIDDLRGRCFTNTAFRLAEDLIRMARREQRLVPLLYAQFQVVNLGQSLFQHQRGCEVAVEMIALLESPDRARQIQTDFSEDEYAQTRAWMTACAYDNLATHTAEIHGFNSEGMHQCISDGIEVCRRTGKLACINCFREYACDVHSAADDLDMALHFSRLGISSGQENSPNDRRCISALNAGKILHLTGDLEQAREMCLRALELTPTYHSPLAAKIKAQMVLEQVLWQMGRGEDFETIAGEKGGARVLPTTEDLDANFRWDLRDAVTACCTGEFDKAIELVEKWDTKLARDKCLHAWFEARLRLMAIHRMAGKAEKVEALAKPLARAAQKARDWLALRRLNRLLDSAEPANPSAMLASPRVGPFAAASVSVPEAVLAAASESGGANDVNSAEQGTVTPLAGLFEQILGRLQASEGDEAVKAEILQQVLDLPADAFANPKDAGAFLYIVPHLVTDVAAIQTVWEWAEATAAPFPQHAGVLNLLATLADVLSGWPESTLGETVEPGRVEALFRKSLELDPDNAPNHARAGAFYLGLENLGEAERCLARGFRLQRENSYIASRLAAIYQNTDRLRDALAVLDLCLREGCEEPGIAWDAAMLAYQVDQHEALLTYLDRFETLQPDQPWVGHYRAMAHLGLGQPKDALEDLEMEASRSPDRPFGTEILRACVASALEQPERFRKHLESVLSLKWSTIDYFSLGGIANLSLRLWNAAECVPADDALRLRLEKHLILAGMAPDTMFETRRQAGPAAQDVKHFRCTLLQPLDKRWQASQGCLHGQESWPAYQCQWGVLASDEEAAARIVLAQQVECYGLKATVENVEDMEQEFKDKPGIVWQGRRWWNEEDEESSDES